MARSIFFPRNQNTIFHFIFGLVLVKLSLKNYLLTFYNKIGFKDFSYVTSQSVLDISLSKQKPFDNFLLRIYSKLKALQMVKISTKFVILFHINIWDYKGRPTMKNRLFYFIRLQNSGRSVMN